MSSIQNVAILGATGSIGRSTLDVIARHPDRFRAFALTAHTQAGELFELALRHRPRFVVLGDEAQARDLRGRLAAAGSAVEVLAGAEALAAVAAHPEVDAVMAAIVGAAGLAPTLAAARAAQEGPAREQGSAGDGRADLHGRGPRGGARPCCRSTASTTRSSSACRRAGAGASPRGASARSC